MDIKNKLGEGNVVNLKKAYNESNGEDFLWELDIKKLSDVEARQQMWLWEGFIPYETCTLITGQPGIGKSQFLTWLASMVSNGSTLRLNSIDYDFPKGSVIFLASEDNYETGLAPRFKAVEANQDKIYFVKSAQNSSTKKKRLLELDIDLHLLEQAVQQIGDVKIIIIDPIASFTGKTKDHINSEVRNFLNSLNELAEKYKISIVLNKHTRKKQGGQSGGIASDEVGGSRAWIEVVRQSFLIVPYHEDENKILFMNLKANISKRNIESFSYSIEEYRYQLKQNEINTSRLKWNNGMIDITANEAMNQDAYEKKTKGQEAIDLINKKLNFGSASVDEIVKEADYLGISRSVLYRAKQKLNITESGSTKRGRIWFLSQDEI